MSQLISETQAEASAHGEGWDADPWFGRGMARHTDRKSLRQFRGAARDRFKVH